MANEEFGAQEQVAGDEASQEATPPADQQGQSGQPQQRVNIDELPEGRALKSTYDTKISALERNIEQERLARMQAERQADEARMSTMDEREQLQYQLDQARKYIQDQDRSRQQEMDELRRERDIDRLASESGAPRDEVANANSYDEAVAVALRYAKQAATEAAHAQAEIAADTSVRNDVDLGSGRPPPETDPWERERLELLERKDPRGYIQHIMGSSEE